MTIEFVIQIGLESISEFASSIKAGRVECQVIRQSGRHKAKTKWTGKWRDQMIVSTWMQLIRKNILVYGLFGGSNSVFLPGIQLL